jgi:hypothetical protein
LSETDFSADFGYARPAVLAGVVFVDQNNNGVQDLGETFHLAMVNITLKDGSGQMTAASGLDGSYVFDGLRPGVYCVNAPPVWQGFVLTTPSAVTLTVGVSGADSGPAFGYISPTAVQLTDFIATPRPTGVQLSWRLALWGQAAPEFHLWRSANGQAWKRLTPTPVGSVSADAEVATYSYGDTAIERGVTYLYRLESATGASYGPWSVRIPAADDTRRFLPWVGR